MNWPLLIWLPGPSPQLDFNVKLEYQDNRPRIRALCVGLWAVAYLSWELSLCCSGRGTCRNLLSALPLGTGRRGRLFGQATKTWLVPERFQFGDAKASIAPSLRAAGATAML